MNTATPWSKVIISQFGGMTAVATGKSFWIGKKKQDPNRNREESGSRWPYNKITRDFQPGSGALRSAVCFGRRLKTAAPCEATDRFARSFRPPRRNRAQN